MPSTCVAKHLLCDAIDWNNIEQQASLSQVQHEQTQLNVL